MRISLAIKRSGSIENKLNKIIYTTFRLILIILIREITLNFRALLTLYFANTRKQPNTISNYNLKDNSLVFKFLY